MGEKFSYGQTAKLMSFNINAAKLPLITFPKYGWSNKATADMKCFFGFINRFKGLCEARQISIVIDVIKWRSFTIYDMFWIVACRWRWILANLIWREEHDLCLSSNDWWFFIQGYGYFVQCIIKFLLKDT
jgi:hypothetical protein